MLIWTVLLGCGQGEPAVVAPTLTERPPEASPVEALSGRWDGVLMREDGPVRELCDQGPFVELRGDGDGGWEMVAQAGPDAELLILPVLRSQRSETGLVLELGAAIPGEPGQRLTITWLEPDRIASFGPPLGDRPYVARRHRDSLPTVPCGG